MGRRKAMEAETKLMESIMQAIKDCNEQIRPGSQACACAEFIYIKIVEAAETGKLPE